MIRAYTIASGKGGTGKTTVAANLGTALAQYGRETCVVDTDMGMANLGLVLGLAETPVTLHEVLAGKASLQDAMYEGPYGLKVVPSGLSLQGFQNADPQRLKEVARELTDRCDYLFFDAPAGISTDAVIPLAVADEVLLVVNPEISSLVDALKIKILTETIGGTVGGAILNRVTPESTEMSRRKIEQTLGVPIIDMIPEDADVRRAAAARTPVVVRSPGSESSKAFRKIAASLAGFPVEKEPGPTQEGFIERLARALFRRVSYD
ncbi:MULTISPECIES: cell division ATPase MinD [unclassified Methanoculleus]|uniref:cell division ATPase MinD n=1 Tax=unclassified Methanoculleus TaxID=2619537 RepID=UPI0025F73972|nr:MULTISPECIES: cell division ATPase MinD [unclassified Methanoculleus]MCK9318718.1 cell division ATPase MinD [Methanoculleus sp.]MDD2254213.1 cell division ATPase MinD [Methanoculleus sp.]MDD2786819.1 cell division ATPase MinD [Methanoculleus sp.]MDD3217274.1 cell division ATPase MinD [Methanoculleus sp.]MDD4314190.1 cell division ATPase MinD [Methanoculleus sp.]